MLFEQERREVAYFMRRLYRQKLTTTSGGNISLRLADGSVALTPAALDKGRLRAAEIVIIGPEGQNLTPHLKASVETRMHLRIYERQPAARAIIHAHPVTASAFTAVATPIDLRIGCEPYALVGGLVMAPYFQAGSAELAEGMGEACAQAPCVLMRNHGVLTTGASLLQAFDRLELIESAAQMTLIVRGLEGYAPLTPEQLAGLDRLMGRVKGEE